MRLTRRVSVTAVVLALLSMGTVGCGAEGVEPESWVRSVCGSLTPWRAEINALTVKTQEQMAGAKTPQETKTNLVALLGGAERASETARKGVADAGVPAVDEGRHIADEFAGSLAKARDAYAGARVTVEQLPVEQAATFYDGVATAFTKLQADYAASEFNTGEVGSEELRRAFDEVPECQ